MLSEFKLGKKYFIYLKILILVVSFLLIFISSFYPADYTSLGYKKQDNNVVCILKKKEFYGLLNHLKIEFSLQSIDISKNSVERCVYMDTSFQSGQGETLEKCYLRGGTITINTYRIYLYSKNNSFLLVSMTNDAFIASQRETTKSVERIKQKITNLLDRTEKNTYKYENKHHSYAISFITFFMAWIALWSLQKMENKLGE